MTAIASRSPWQSGVGAAGGTALLFAAYCQAHGWVDSAPAPADASLRWGLLAGAPAGALAWMFWSARGRIVRHASRGATAAAAFLVGLFALLLVGGGIAHALAGRTPGAGALDELGGALFDRLPLAAALTACTAALVFRTGHRADRAGLHPPVRSTEWIALPEEPLLRLRAAELRLVRAAGNYCELHAAGRTHLVRVPIKTLADRLAAADFVRVHRSALVNLARVSAIEPAPGGQAEVRLDCGSRVPVGRAFHDALMSALSARSSLPDAVRH
jgi:hypothetical protein